jgi:hypothetical protein
MVSDQYKAIFVEVPKTGSTSIRQILGNPEKPHLDIKEIFSKMIKYDGEEMALNKFSSYFKFGFVRNPWDRVVSLYERKEGIQMKDKMVFSEFVHWIENSSDTCIHPSVHKNQLDWFTDSKGSVIVDFIGKFENLESDWKYVAQKIGAPVHLEHMNKNPNKNKPYQEYYTDDLRDLVFKKFLSDIEYFGYKY